MPFVDKCGRVQQGAAPSRPLLTDRQRTVAATLAVLLLPSLALRSWRQARSDEGVDLSRFSIAKDPFDTPALLKRDGVIRIEFCASWQVRGQFARVGDELRVTAPQLPLLAGPYVPPRSVQGAVMAVRAAQVLALGGYLLGESLFASSPRALALLARLHEHRFALGIGLYLLHVCCEAAKSTAAFEVTYDGVILFSKLHEGRWPNPGEVAANLAAVLAAEARQGTQLVVTESEATDDAEA